MQPQPGRNPVIRDSFLGTLGYNESSPWEEALDLYKPRISCPTLPQDSLPAPSTDLRALDFLKLGDVPQASDQLPITPPTDQPSQLLEQAVGLPAQRTTTSPQTAGQKRKASVVAGSSQTPESGESVQASQEDRPRKRARQVGHKSCKACRQQKRKCFTDNNSATCTYCAKTGTACDRDGVDNRTNQTKIDQLRAELREYYSVTWEFLTVLKLLGPEHVDTPQGQEVLRLHQRGLSPSKIMEYAGTDMPQPPRIKPIDQFCKPYEKLSEVRKAIKDAKSCVLRLLCCLHQACIGVREGSLNGLEVELVVVSVMEGTLDDEVSEPEIEAAVRSLYKDGLKPSTQALEVAPNCCNFVSLA